MTLRDIIATDATIVFLKAAEFGESVTYKPFTYPGDAVRAERTINAMVSREQYTVMAEDGDHVSYTFEVHVANDVLLGITGAELDLGGDVLSFPSRDGETAEDHSVVKLTRQDHGMLVLECR